MVMVCARRGESLCKDNPISFFDFEGGDPAPAQYQSFFLNYAATNSGAIKHKNPYSLCPME